MSRLFRKISCFFAIFALVLALPVLPGFGQSHTVSAAGTTYKVIVSEGYLALRTAKAYDSRNEIGKLYTGDLVTVQDSSDSTYWYVYASRLGKYGYVNSRYLEYYSDETSKLIYGVSVSKGYLALRTAKAYDARNEIGKLYNGERSFGDDNFRSEKFLYFLAVFFLYG